MTGMESLVTNSGIASGLLPVDVGLAVWILIGALALSGLALGLAASPPSSLVRRLNSVRERGPARGVRRRKAAASA